MGRTIKTPLGDKPATPASLRERSCVTVQVVTPMYGGGAEAGVIDETTPISAKSIRGHLRQWWRWMRGPELENSTDMHRVELMARREAEVFGSTECASPFDLEICNVKTAGKHDRPPYDFQLYGPEMYALFPTRQSKPKIWKAGLCFELQVQWHSGELQQRRIAALAQARDEENKKNAGAPPIPLPWDIATLRQELETALWAWLNFGGVGARTRRGLGAVQLRSAAPWQGELLLPMWIPQVLLHRDPADDALQAWGNALQQYQNFRQQRSTGRKKQIIKYDRKANKLRIEKPTQTPGRSKWPEPDSIRKLTGNSLKRKTHTLPGGLGDYTFPSHEPGNSNEFPRASLGLPMVFRFADGHGSVPSQTNIAEGDLDPAQSELCPIVLDAGGKLVKGERMASPVIIRPLLVNGNWHAAFVLLDDAHLRGLEVVLISKQIEGCQSTPQPISSATQADGLSRLTKWLLSRNYTPHNIPVL